MYDIILHGEYITRYDSVPEHGTNYTCFWNKLTRYRISTFFSKMLKYSIFYVKLYVLSAV